MASAADLMLLVDIGVTALDGLVLREEQREAGARLEALGYVVVSDDRAVVTFQGAEVVLAGLEAA